MKDEEDGGRRRIRSEAAGAARHSLHPIPWLRWGFATLLVVVGLGGFWYPGSVVVRCFFDDTLRHGGLSPLALKWHRALTPRYEKWARARVVSGKAQHLDTSDISGTEWPLFGSAFYLWGTEAIQDAWEKDPHLSSVAPRESARGAIDAAVELVIDPKHAGWVRKHWGDRYLDTENAFFRMLLISAMTSGWNLTGSPAHEAFLRSQADSLAVEIDASPTGLLDDYPGQCFPTDVLSSIAAIRRSDALTKSDHSAFVQRALRAFEGRSLDSLGLPPYSADARTGVPYQPSRGCGVSYCVLRGRELWPERADEWYATYEKHFWQDEWLTPGFREFPKEVPNRNWYFDVDAGPVMRGIGFAASAFGVATARAQGRYDHAYPLTLQMVALSWPLPNGRLLVPLGLSNVEDAPMLGEAAIVYVLSQPGTARVIPSRWAIPGLVWICLAFYFGTGALLLWWAGKLFKGRRRPGKAERRANAKG